MPAKAHTEKVNAGMPDATERHNPAYEPLAVADGLDSPARKLQSYLENNWDDASSEQLSKNRWSTRRTLAFVIVTCSLFWALVIFAGGAIF